MRLYLSESDPCIMVTSRGGMGTRRQPGSGQVLHYPDPAGYYFEVYLDPGNLSQFLQLFLTQ